NPLALLRVLELACLACIPTHSAVQANSQSPRSAPGPAHWQSFDHPLFAHLFRCHGWRVAATTSVTVIPALTVQIWRNVAILTYGTIFTVLRGGIVGGHLSSPSSIGTSGLRSATLTHCPSGCLAISQPKNRLLESSCTAN